MHQCLKLLTRLLLWLSLSRHFFFRFFLVLLLQSEKAKTLLLPLIPLLISLIFSCFCFPPPPFNFSISFFSSDDLRKNRPWCLKLWERNERKRKRKGKHKVCFQVPLDTPKKCLLIHKASFPTPNHFLMLVYLDDCLI